MKSIEITDNASIIAFLNPAIVDARYETLRQETRKFIEKNIKQKLKPEEALLPEIANIRNIIAKSILDTGQVEPFPCIRNLKVGDPFHINVMDKIFINTFITIKDDIVTDIDPEYPELLK